MGEGVRSLGGDGGDKRRGAALIYKILKYTNKMNVKMCDIQDIWETEGGES